MTGPGPFRILAVNPTGQASGAETVLLRVLGAAVADGADVTCMSPPGPLRDRLAAAGVPWRPLPDLKLPAGGRAVGAATLAARTVVASRALAKAGRRCDVILVNGFFALPALRLARVPTPTVWLVHDVVRRRSWLRILGATRRAVDLALAVSEAAADPLRRAGLRVEVRRNGTPWPVAGIDGPPEPEVIGCAGLLTSWKGQDVLLDAVARLARPGLVVELAGGQFPGDAAYVEGLRRRAEQADLAGRVRFLGPVADVGARMRTWRVLASPSVDPEAGSLSIIEAMSIGLPVVATHHGGSPEYLGQAGLLVPPRDAAALSVALGLLLDDRPTWDRCHRAGPAMVADELQLADQQRDVLRILADTAGHPVPSGR